MIYGSVCSGVEAATLAWEPLGWRAAFFSEIEKFPRAVLQHRWPGIPLHGDFTTITGTEYAKINLLVGGTPCQSFSRAGQRKGVADPRGQLTPAFFALTGKLRPRWVVWENVPDVLSDDEGRAFSAVVGTLEKLGYGWAYRTFDAQYFRVPQQRRRVFLIASLGSWQRAAAVLFERESLRGNPPKIRETPETVAALTANGVGVGGPDVAHAQAGHIVVHARQDPQVTRGVTPPLGMMDRGHAVCVTGDNTHTLRGEGFDASEDGTGRGTPITPIHARTLGANDDRNHVEQTYIPARQGVRRLTPLECERLQGMPDGHTLIPWRGKTADSCPDGPRYKAIGNSMAVPVMAWIGRRIEEVERVT